MHKVQPRTIIYKKLGETPLEALERFRLDEDIADDVPMTYAGRLDPMAEGKLLILVGDECRKKEKYLGLDKEYEIEVLFGIETDSYDLLGMSRIIDNLPILDEVKNVNFSKYVGTFNQEYPPYSSKTVNGKQLHELARANKLPENVPTKFVEIYRIDNINWSTIDSVELEGRIKQAISKVTGDFRQAAILEQWHHILSKYNVYHVVSCRVHCSSGTYMRSLAQRIGKDAGCGACALSIKRVALCDTG